MLRSLRVVCWSRLGYAIKPLLAITTLGLDMIAKVADNYSCMLGISDLDNVNTNSRLRFFIAGIHLKRTAN